MKGTNPVFSLKALLPPVLLAAYSVLVLYAQNINELEPGEILPTLIAVLVGSLLGTGLLAYIFKDATKAGVTGAFLVLVILFYGLFFSGIDSVFGGKVWHKAFLPAVLILLIAVIWWSIKTEERSRQMNSVLLVISSLLVAMPVAQITQYLVFEQKEVTIKPETKKTVVSGKKDSNWPNVYYLIFDRYAANRTLINEYGFDNKTFLQDLKERGFFVNEASFANYTKTAHSLASSLNMQYLDFLMEELGGGSNDFKPLYHMIKNFEVWKVLKALGYRYIHLGSWWTATRTNSLADESYNIDNGSEFLDLYLSNTVFILNQEFMKKTKSSWVKQCNRVLYKFEKLEELANREETLFVFAHMLVPHPPFVFDEDGNCMDGKYSRSRSIKTNYIGQVKFVNGKIIKLVDSLIARDPKSIIIIQSDEGPFPERYREDEIGFDWSSATDRELQQKFRILNALYVPKEVREKLYQGMTPVNTFRMLFSEYYGLKYPKLPDRAFTFLDGAHLYDFIEVTDIVR